MFEAVCLAVKRMNGAGDLLFSSAQSVADPQADELIEQLAMARAAVVSLTAKVLDLEDARDREEREPDELVKKVRTEARAAEDHAIDE